MKRVVAILVLLTVCAGFSMAGDDGDKAAIRKVISEAYVDGLQNGGDLEKTRAGFDPTFNLLIQGKDGNLKRYAIKDWIAKAAERKAQHPEGPQVKTTVKFTNIDVTGTAAVARIELYKADKLVYTDYLSMYKFGENWRIVSKIYFRH